MQAIFRCADLLHEILLVQGYDLSVQHGGRQNGSTLWKLQVNATGLYALTHTGLTGDERRKGKTGRMSS
jgi:hypothetical protein